MAGQSTSTVIIFIAAMLTASLVAGTLTTTVGKLQYPVDEISSNINEQLTTDIEIISDTGNTSSIYNNSTNTVTLLIKNTGSQPLHPNTTQFDILIDTTYTPATNVTLLDSQDTRWSAGEVVRVTMKADLTTGEHTITVYVNEKQDRLRFYHA